MERTMEWAAKANHMGGIPRRIVFTATGAFTKAVTTLFNTTTGHNADTLIRFVRSRPSGVPLSRHLISTLTDQLVSQLDIVSKMVNSAGKCIPITRGAGIYQEHVNEAIEGLSDGAWGIIPGRCAYENIKRGTASLKVCAPVTPIILPIYHHGFEEVMPDKFFLGKKPPLPLWKKIKIMVGENFEFDLPNMKQMAISTTRDKSPPLLGWPSVFPHTASMKQHRDVST